MFGVAETARKGRLLFVLLVAAHLIAISGQVDGGQGTSLLGRLILGLFSPPQRWMLAAVDGVRDLWSAYLGLQGVHRENQELRRRIAEVETRFQQRQRQAEEAERLRDLLGLRKLLPYDTIAAEVISRDPLPWYRILMVNQGLEAGVRLDMPVIAPTGVIGRVVAVGPKVARVQTLLDNASGVGAVIERSRVNGVVSGQLRAVDESSHDAQAEGEGTILVMKYVLAHADVVVGDAVVTSGLDRIYPKGLLVGRVRTIAPPTGLFKDLLVTPAAQFSQIEEVLVLKQMEDQPILSQAVTPEAR